MDEAGGVWMHMCTWTLAFGSCLARTSFVLSRSDRGERHVVRLGFFLLLCGRCGVSSVLPSYPVASRADAGGG